MYAEYAKDPKARRNVGIGRRLAPLIDNDRRVAELLHMLLLSMPGSPVLYYGDEILMGDNLFLGDRDGVRTPMQWTSDRNGGFSRADYSEIYLPPLMDPVFGYLRVNVESSMKDPSSFLNWLRKMIWLRRNYDVFGMGSFDVIHSNNKATIAYVRHLSEDGSTVVCVSNFSARTQYTTIDLSKFINVQPIEFLGGEPFPVISGDPYALTLAPYGSIWLDLSIRKF